MEVFALRKPAAQSCGESGSLGPSLPPADARAESSQRENCHLPGGSIEMRPTVWICGYALFRFDKARLFCDGLAPLRTISTTLLLCILMAFVPRVGAFALLGPLKNRANNAPDPWQGKPYAGRPGGLGYELPGDIGGPMFINEAYRWNVPVIYYGFDKSFMDYFGQPGIDAVESAIAILNAIPPASEMSPGLTEFYFDTKGENGTAASLNFLDLKSYALALLLEQIGLANPERFVWGLRSRVDDSNGITYSVVQMNYDPETHLPSPFVNGVLYNYRIFDDLGPTNSFWASATEWFRLDPFYLPYSSLAGGLGSFDFQLGNQPSDFFFSQFTGLTAGQFFYGLTRDDVGGLRYLLGRDTKFREPLVPGVMGNGTNASSFVDVALRGGVEKLTFAMLKNDYSSGGFLCVTNSFLDVYHAHGVVVTQSLHRVLREPDILFSAHDLGGEFYHDAFGGFFSPFLYQRSGTSHWQNNARLNQKTEEGGPGIIRPGARITFNTLGRYVFAADREQMRFAPYLRHWATFDGSKTPPRLHLGPVPSGTSHHLGTKITTNNGIQCVRSTFVGEIERYYRIDISTNLVDWAPWNWLYNYDGLFSIELPADGASSFLRLTPSDWPW